MHGSAQRIISVPVIAAVVVALLVTLLAPAGAGAQQCGRCGDVNGDGQVDIIDALFIGQLTVELRASLQCPAQADVNQDGKTDIVDALFIAQFTVGVRTGLVCASLQIDSPQSLALFNSSPITVSGHVRGQATVACNGVPATVTGTQFSASVPLRAGDNVIACLATDTGNMIGSAHVSVTLDNVAPMLVIDSPQAGLITSADHVDVTGVVNDVLAGLGAPVPEVRVNGVVASVSNNTFVAAGVPLKPGPNTLTAIGTDNVSNQGSTSIGVTRQDLAGQRIRIVSGNNQSGVTGTPLANPLVVELDDANGAPVVGRQAMFAVTRGSGTLAGGSGNGQTLNVTSGADGRASVQFALGANSGEGSHRVTANALGFTGEAVFCASAVPSAADHIVVISGDHQMGVTGELLPRPLIAAVLDPNGNPITGVPVTFSVIEGGGALPDTSMVTMMTGPDGKAAATLRLGPAAGVNNNEVQAAFPNLIGSAASFRATANQPRPTSETSVSGIVVDNTDLPLPGTTLAIIGTELLAIADQQGRFHISGVPVGPVRLFVDGSTTSRDGVWPNLEFNLVTVAGQDNGVGVPIRLPVLDGGSSKIVGGDTDVTLTLADVPGFALTVFAHSATFPDDSSVNRLTVSQVHFDKVPMPPPNGSQFTLAWTIQPASVRFNPPAHIQIPNSGMPPGQIIDMFSFDHDLGMFVSIGTASVSADGSVVQSDPGFGIFKTGWGGCTPPPPPPGDADNSKDPINDKNVRKKVKGAWNDSRPGTGIDPNRAEHGGWIVRNGDGSFTVSDWPTSAASGIMSTPKPTGAIGSFHTHPNSGPSPGGATWKPGPSPPDVSNIINHPEFAPHYVVSKDTIYRINKDGSVDEIGSFQKILGPC